MAELGAPDRPRRGRKPKLRESLAATTALEDDVIQEQEAPAADPVAEPKAKRGRKPKGQPAALEMEAEPAPAEDETPAAEPAVSLEEPVPEDAAPPMAEEPPPAKVRRGRKPKMQPEPEPEPVKARRGRKQAADIPAEPETPVPAPEAAPQPSAAHWDAATGSATFDWPVIEQVAAQEGPNQAMAKLLLAARAEGANSRWPF